MQGPWTIETACLGMRAFQAGDEEELKIVASDSEFVRAVRETLEAHGVDAADVHERLPNESFNRRTIIIHKICTD